MKTKLEMQPKYQGLISRIVLQDPEGTTFIENDLFISTHRNQIGPIQDKS